MADEARIYAAPVGHTADAQPAAFRAAELPTGDPTNLRPALAQRTVSIVRMP